MVRDDLALDFYCSAARYDERGRLFRTETGFGPSAGGEAENLDWLRRSVFHPEADRGVLPARHNPDVPVGVVHHERVGRRRITADVMVRGQAEEQGC
jgi:hypothetical protein